MKITNTTGLPEAFINFARDDKYSKGKADISVTTLIDSPRVRMLKDKHRDVLQADVSDMIWPLFGTAVHHILESARETDAVTVEERLYAEVLGWTMSGALDHQEVLPDGTVQITDYKVTSAWSVILGKEDWELQQNCYAWLVENSLDGINRGRKVSSIRICAILRDWQKRKAQFDKDYPQSPVVVLELPLWSAEKRDAYILERVDAHQQAQVMFDTEDRLPLCSAKEQWAKPDSWAVKEKGKSRAKRVLETEEEAQAYIDASINEDDEFLAEETKKLYIEYRKGELTRCDGYCSVSEFCDQYKGWIKR